jgi:hypothetical protein
MKRLRVVPFGLGAVVGLTLLACTSPAYFNNTTSLGGATPGSRGSVTVLFDNRTPYRAVFTYGIFDQQDRAFLFNQDQVTNRQLGQFVLNPDTTNPLQEALVGNTSSTPVALICGRTLAVGTQRLTEVIQISRLQVGLDEQALTPGIAFWPANEANPTAPVATIEGINVLQGYEFQCDDSSVIFTLSQNADGTFAITWEVILP